MSFSKGFLVDLLSPKKKWLNLMKNRHVYCDTLNCRKAKGLGGPAEMQKLEQVNLITPENIHLNSFMYEPILDMGSAHLRSWYLDVKQLA